MNQRTYKRIRVNGKGARRTRQGKIGKNKIKGKEKVLTIDKKTISDSKVSSQSYVTIHKTYICTTQRGTAWQRSAAYAVGEFKPVNGAHT
jgi:hypothetical protein